MAPATSGSASGSTRMGAKLSTVGDGTAAELVPLAEAGLELDADEAGALLRRLSTPPPGRRTFWVRADGPDGPVGLLAGSVNDRDPAAGHLDLVLVHPSLRRHHLGTVLVRQAERKLGELGVREVRWAGNPPCYGWPGIDVRYTAALCCAESLGYEKYQAAQNMTVDLAAADLETRNLESALAAAGVTVRRATPDDLPPVAAWVRTHWNDTWAWEMEQSVLGPGASCHLALRDGAVVAFAGRGANRPSWFGPMGTEPAARNLKLGKVLLRRCLADQRDAGLTRAQISWVGPIPFYARTVGARVERIFWLYRKALAGT